MLFVQKKAQSSSPFQTVLYSSFLRPAESKYSSLSHVTHGRWYSLTRRTRVTEFPIQIYRLASFPGFLSLDLRGLGAKLSTVLKAARVSWLLLLVLVPGPYRRLIVHRMHVSSVTVITRLRRYFLLCLDSVDCSRMLARLVYSTPKQSSTVTSFTV